MRNKKSKYIGLAKNTANATAPAPQSASYDNLGKLPNKEKLVQSISVNLQRFPYSNFAKDLSNWSEARNWATNLYAPKRHRLMGVYRDAMLDLFLSGIIQKRILKITNRKFKLVDASGETNKEITKLINKQWMRDFLKYAIESRFYGHSLIEFAMRKDNLSEIKACKLIDRRYVAPEFNLFLINPFELTGYNYTEPPYNSFALGIGESEDLGLLLKLSLFQFIKKNALGNWSEFAEIFGMPMRYANTPTIDPNVRKDVEDMLENIGSSAWGVFPMGTDIKLIESTKTDSFKVYDELANRINKEMSICILGQTMTTEDGSSRSQAEVHERTEDEVTNDDKAFIQHYIDDNLLPLLANMGYPVKGLCFEWDDKENIALDKRVVIDESISRMGFKFKKEYIESTYGVEVEEMPQPEPAPQPEPDDKVAKQIKALYN